MVYNVKNVIPVIIAAYRSVLKVDMSDSSYSVPFCYQVKKPGSEIEKKKWHTYAYLKLKASVEEVNNS